MVAGAVVAGPACGAPGRRRPRKVPRMPSHAKVSPTHMRAYLQCTVDRLQWWSTEQHKMLVFTCGVARYLSALPNHAILAQMLQCMHAQRHSSSRPCPPQSSLCALRLLSNCPLILSSALGATKRSFLTWARTKSAPFSISPSLRIRVLLHPNPDFALCRAWEFEILVLARV